MNIEEARKDIDKMDDNIIELLAKRKNLIKEIASIKKELNKPIIDEEREQEIIERLKKISKEKDLDENFISSIYEIILNNSKEEQGKI